MELSKQVTDWPSGMCNYKFTCTGKVHPRIGHEGPEVEKRRNYTLSLTPELDEVGGQRHTPTVLPPGNAPLHIV